MRNDIKSITVARMEVPCCAGMERAVKMALKESGKKIPVKRGDFYGGEICRNQI